MIDKLTIGETVGAEELTLASVLCFEIQGMSELVDEYIKRESHATEAWNILSNIDHAIFSFTENHTDLYIVSFSTVGARAVSQLFRTASSQKISPPLHPLHGAMDNSVLTSTGPHPDPTAPIATTS